MAKFPYQIGLLGDYHQHEKELHETIGRRFRDLGYTEDDFSILCGDGVLDRERRAPFAAIYFGHDQANEEDPRALVDVLKDSAVVLPIVEDISSFSASVPIQIRHINGVQIDPDDPKFERDVGTIIENFRLLRKDRRLFISYKRDDSRRIALQLYEALDARGFDVFLDTHGVPPGADFQAVLWHRLADSDVVVLLDTPNFFESRWAREELTRANATSIQVLHLLWPGRSPPPEAALSSFLPLEDKDFRDSDFGGDGVLLDSVVKRIFVEVEGLRARALASRHRFLVDAFCDEARRLGVEVDVQPSRHIVFKGAESEGFVMPLVGVPSARRLHEVYEALFKEESPKVVWALFDNRGLLSSTIDHLAWLNISLPLKAVSVYDVAKALGKEASE